MGVRQGDPLSPLLFCLAEDVLSRSITKLVNEEKIRLTKGTRSMQPPSHTLYADDIMLFCQGNSESIKSISDLLKRYSLASGQHVNLAKSIIYIGAMTNQRQQSIANILGFCIGVLPFIYLGVPMFKGKPKAIHFQHIADRVRVKLAAWKASLLSIAGRVLMVKSVIHSLLLHSILIYDWPVSIIKQIEGWIRNFIWSGDINKRKMVTVAWHKCCKPIAEGGLGLRSITKLNEASNMKLCWEMMTSDEDWCRLIRSRVLRGNKQDSPIRHHVFSSIWSGMKHKFQEIQFYFAWLFGRGDKINFWNDNWTGHILADYFQIPDWIKIHLKASVKDFIHNNQWCIPDEMQNMFPALLNLISKIKVPTVEIEDERIWSPTDNGQMPLKAAYTFHAPEGQNINWGKIIWSSAIPPSKSLLIRRMFHNSLPTDENLISRGLCIPSICNLCFKKPESTKHLFFECSFANHIWSWLTSILNSNATISSNDDIINLMNKQCSPQCKVVTLSAIINAVNVIWFARNQIRFNNTKVHWRSSITRIKIDVNLSGNSTNKVSSPSITDFVILKAFNVTINPPKTPTVIEVVWQPTIFDWIKCNTDSVASGMSGLAGSGGIFRDCNADHLGSFALKVENGNALKAELVGAMTAIEVAYERNWRKLWLETDSKLVVSTFKSNSIVRWQLRQRWNQCILLSQSMDFVVTHIYKEGNHCADKLANLGLTSTEMVWLTNVHLSITDDFARNKLGQPCFRFVT